MTRITQIIEGIECTNIPLDKDHLHGGPLLDEIIKLAVMTFGFYMAEKINAQYRAPFKEVRTQVCLKELMLFACQDGTKPSIVAFCTKALKPFLTEENLAVKTLYLYLREYEILRRSTPWDIPTDIVIGHAIKQAIGKRTETLGRPYPSQTAWPR